MNFETDDYSNILINKILKKTPCKTQPSVNLRYI